MLLSIIKQCSVCLVHIHLGSPSRLLVISLCVCMMCDLYSVTDAHFITPLSFLTFKFAKCYRPLKRHLSGPTRWILKYCYLAAVGVANKFTTPSGNKGQTFWLPLKICLKINAKGYILIAETVSELVYQFVGFVCLFVFVSLSQWVCILCVGWQPKHELRHRQTKHVLVLQKGLICYVFLVLCFGVILIKWENSC